MKKALLIGLVPLGFLGMVLIFSILGAVFSHLESKGHEAYAAAESARLAELERMEAAKAVAEQKRLGAIENAKQTAILAEREKVAAAERGKAEAAEKKRQAALAAVQAEKERLESEKRIAAKVAAATDKGNFDFAKTMAREWALRQTRYPAEASLGWDTKLDKLEATETQPLRYRVRNTITMKNGFGVRSEEWYSVEVFEVEPNTFGIWFASLGSVTERHEKNKPD